jgi:hypothetical protein
MGDTLPDLDHDTLTEAAMPKFGKIIPRPTKHKMVETPPVSKAAEQRANLRTNRPWLDANNPAIWDGEID